MFVDFLLCIGYFQLGFELTFGYKGSLGWAGSLRPRFVALQATANPQQLQEDA